jgi:hypothetical protein
VSATPATRRDFLRLADAAEEAVRAAEAAIKPIFDKWRERGKI